MAAKRRKETAREFCLDTGELFGRLDAVYYYATGKRLDRSNAALATVEALLCNYGMAAVDEVWAWWMRHPEYGGGCDEPLDAFADESVFADLSALAFQEEARARLAARFATASVPKAVQTAFSVSN